MRVKLREEIPMNTEKSPEEIVNDVLSQLPDKVLNDAGPEAVSTMRKNSIRDTRITLNKLLGIKTTPRSKLENYPSPFFIYFI